MSDAHRRTFALGRGGREHGCDHQSVFLRRCAADLRAYSATAACYLSFLRFMPRKN